MSITLRASTLSNSGSQGNHTINKPTGTLEGDTLFWYITINGVNTINSISAGFTLVPGSVVSLGTTTSYVYRKLALSDEPTNYTVNWSSTGNISTYLSSVYSDVLNPIVVDAIATQVNASSTNRVFPSVTTTAANDFLFAYATLGTNQVSTPDALMTELTDPSQAPKIYAMRQTVAAIGATGTRTATGTATTSATILMALKEGTPLPNSVLVSQAGLYTEVMPITQVNVTQAGVYVEVVPDVNAKITQFGTYLETGYIPQVRITQLGVYLETAFNSAFGGIAPPTISAADFSSTRIDITLGITATSYLGHLIEYSLDGLTGWVEIADLGVGVNTFSHTGLTPVTTYYYRARAYDADNEGVNSSVTSDTTHHPIKLRSFTDATSNFGNNVVTVVTPVGVLENDLMLLTIYNQTADVALPIVPVGWNLLYSNEEVETHDVRVFYKYATAAEPVNFEVTLNSINVSYYGITAWYSDDGEIVTVDDLRYGFYSASTNRNTPVTNPTAPFTVLVNMLTTQINQSNTPQSGWTEYWDIGNIVHAYTASKQYLTTAPTDTLVATGASVSSVRSLSVLLRRASTLPTLALDVQAVLDSYDTILIAWSEFDSSNDGYIIERSLDGSTGWTQVGDVAQGVEIFEDDGLSSLTTYYYRVRGYIGTEFSNPSNVASDTTPFPTLLRAFSTHSFISDLTSVVNKPVGTLEGDLMFLAINVLDAGTNNVPVGWNLLTGNPGAIDAKKLQVYYKYAGPAEPDTYTIDWGGVSRSAIVTLASLYSAKGQSLIIEDDAIASYASDPSGNRMSPQVTSIETDALANAFVGLEASLLTDPTNGYVQVSNNITPSGISLWYGTKQLPTVDTTPEIVATGGTPVIHNSYSVVVSIGSVVLPPDDPTLLTATTISDLTIHLEWIDNATDELGYAVERSVNSSDWDAIADLPPNTTEYYSSGLLGETLYYYRVRAYNIGGSSGYSNVASNTTEPTRIYYQFSNVANATTLPI